MLDNPVFVSLVLPVIPAVLVLVVVTRALRRDLGFKALAAVSSICAIATYVVLVLLLQAAGVQP